jgi:hypothetical protein
LILTCDRTLPQKGPSFTPNWEGNL